jgi:hypothetical protein
VRTRKIELLLAESLQVAHDSGALRTKDLERVTVDTTVQPKAVSFPTDARLLHAAIRGLTRLARKHGVRLRQSYRRIAKRAAMMAGRYAHAKQFKRHHRERTGFVVLVAGRGSPLPTGKSSVEQIGNDSDDRQNSDPAHQRVGRRTSHTF